MVFPIKFHNSIIALLKGISREDDNLPPGGSPKLPTDLLTGEPSDPV